MRSLCTATKSSPRLLQLEKACAQQRRPSATKNEQINELIKKKAGVAIFISDKIDFKIKAVTRDKEGHYIMIKGSIQEDITIVNMYASNIGTPQYIRQILTANKGRN